MEPLSKDHCFDTHLVSSSRRESFVERIVPFFFSSRGSRRHKAVNGKYPISKLYPSILESRMKEWRIRSVNTIKTSSKYTFFLVSFLFHLHSSLILFISRWKNYILVNASRIFLLPRYMHTYREDIAQRRSINTLSRLLEILSLAHSAIRWRNVGWTIYVYKRCHRSLLARIVHRRD